jgi:hypothetical protein
MTLTNCQAIGNGTGMVSEANTGTAAITIANCVVSGNQIGLYRVYNGGIAEMYGTDPGTNLVSDNTNNLTTTGKNGLQ